MGKKRKLVSRMARELWEEKAEEERRRHDDSRIVAVCTVTLKGIDDVEKLTEEQLYKRLRTIGEVSSIHCLFVESEEEK